MWVCRDSAVTAAGQISLVQYAGSQTTRDIYSINCHVLHCSKPHCHVLLNKIKFKKSCTYLSFMMCVHTVVSVCIAQVHT